MKTQRLRFRYRVTPDALALGSRDTAAAWVEAMTAAGFKVARSSGKRAGPLVSIAAPLSLGATSDWELVDVYLEDLADPREALCRVSSLLPAGIVPVGVSEVGLAAPSLQSQLRWAEYEVDILSQGTTREQILAAIVGLMQTDTFPAEHRRDKKTKQYDLRPLVFDITLEGTDDAVHRLRLRLRAEPERTARADQTVLALGLPEPVRVHRVRLFIEETPAVVSAFRAVNEREGG